MRTCSTPRFIRTWYSAPALPEEPLINMFRSAGLSTLFIPPLALPFPLPSRIALRPLPNPLLIPSKLRRFHFLRLLRPSMHIGGLGK